MAWIEGHGLVKDVERPIPIFPSDRLVGLIQHLFRTLNGRRVESSGVFTLKG